jgi:zinc/manganese transport system permease protein
MVRSRLLTAWALGAAGYAVGLLVSTAADLPSGPVIVWMLVAFAVVVQATARQRLPSG